jgi:hypothetical protein
MFIEVWDCWKGGGLAQQLAARDGQGDAGHGEQGKRRAEPGILDLMAATPPAATPAGYARAGWG